MIEIIKEYLSKICSKTEEKKFRFGKKRFGSYSKIGPWFRFPIPKPGFGCTLTLEYKTVSAPDIAFKHI